MNASALFSRSPHPEMFCHTLDLRLLCGLWSTRGKNLYLGRNLRELLLSIEVPEYTWMDNWRALYIVYDLRIKFATSRTTQR